MTTDELTRGERTRLSILEAAHDLFLENGYGGTGMRQIAEQAGGIAVGGIYNHFSSKEDILHRLIEARSPAPVMIAALEEAEGETGTELLSDALRRLMLIAAEHIDFIQLAYIDLQKFGGEGMVRVIESILPTVARFGQKVVEAGGLRSELNPLVMMRMFVVVLIGFALTERMAFRDGQPRVALIPDLPQAQWVDTLLDAYLHGVAAEG